MRSAGHTLVGATCIDENAIGELFDHRLTKAEVEQIDEHVSRCSTCRDLLCSLARLYSSSSPSRALVETAALLDLRSGASGASSSVGIDQVHVKRLLALLSCERQVGRVLRDKWRLDAVLGVGGMAEVYAATHLSNGRRAAIKMLRREWLSRPNVVYRFLREGYVANRISHPGAVTILDDGTDDDGVPFLVLEFLEGQTIAPHVRERLPLETVLWIASGILDVLSAAHAQEIIHRDIKPDNVFLTRDGSVKVLDFGIARMRELADAGASELDPGTRGDRDTQHGTMMGTPAYMPPEQARGRWEEIDARADVWAVGATMFALLSGRTVRSGASAHQMLLAALQDPAPSLATVCPSVPSEICAIVDRALAFRREDRWPTARGMQDAIRELLWRMEGDASAPVESVAPMALSAPLPIEPHPRRSSSGGAWVVLGAVVALVLSVAFGVRGSAPRHSVSAAAQSAVAAMPTVAPSASEVPAVPVAALPGAPVDAKGVRDPKGARPKAGRRGTARRAEVPDAPAEASATAPATPPPAPPPQDDRSPLDRRD